MCTCQWDQFTQVIEADRTFTMTRKRSISQVSETPSRENIFTMDKKRLRKTSEGNVDVSQIGKKTPGKKRTITQIINESFEREKSKATSVGNQRSIEGGMDINRARAMVDSNQIMVDPDEDPDLQSSVPEYDESFGKKNGNSHVDGWNDDKEDDLIDEYEANRLLYDKTWPGYSNKAKKNSVLQSIAKKLGFDSK